MDYIMKLKLGEATVDYHLSLLMVFVFQWLQHGVFFYHKPSTDIELLRS